MGYAELSNNPDELILFMKMLDRRVQDKEREMLVLRNQLHDVREKLRSLRRDPDAQSC